MKNSMMKSYAKKGFCRICGFGRFFVAFCGEGWLFVWGWLQGLSFGRFRIFAKIRKQV